MATESEPGQKNLVGSDCAEVERTYTAEEVNLLLTAMWWEIRPVTDLAVKILELESRWSHHVEETRTALKSGLDLPVARLQPESEVQDSSEASEVTLESQP